MGVNMWLSCYQSVVELHCMPIDAPANFQYYAHSELPPDIAVAVHEASIFDVMLVTRVRATHVSFLLTEKKGCSADPRSFQGYVKVLQDVDTSMYW
jgi:hypothetical protein